MQLRDLLAAGFPTQINVQGTGDITPPLLAALSLSASTVDVSSADQTIVVTLRITDDLSGIRSSANGLITFISPSRLQRVSTGFHETTRESGTALDGVYTNTLFMPRYSESGTWSVDTISVTDGAGNRRVLFLNDMLADELPNQITVQGTADTTAPQAASLSYSITTVDTTSASQSVIVTLGITDGLSGFTTNTGAAVTFLSPSGKQFRGVSFDPRNRSSGIASDGVYTNSLVFPRFSEPGQWTLDEIYVRDSVGNERRLRLAQARQAALPTEILVTEEPLLRIFRSDSTVLVSWWTPDQGFHLQYRGTLGDADAWNTVHGTPSEIGGERVFAFPHGAMETYYRLFKPPAP